VFDEEYLHAILEWRVNMDANLRRENDWLALAGLFWLQKGFNTFGSSHDCDILLPKQAPHLIGAFEFDGTENIVLHIEMGQVGEINGEPIQSTAVLKTDQGDPPSLITFKEIGLLVIQRADRFGVYVWDNLRPQRSEFPPRIWFPVDEKSLVIAHYTPYVLPIKVELRNPFGELENEVMLGYVSFRYRDKALKLDATELSDGCLYLQFKDLTNGEQTYPSGRYLTTTEPVGEEGLVFLDFNRSYNPPSAFSDYAICNFASKMNHLKVAIEAGELYELPHEKNTA
jgi:uncharacterized protein (DUF1684 family)